MAELNEMQRRFVAAYLIEPNATQAAIKAGYSEKTAKSQGQRLLTHVDIQAEIDAKRKRLEMKSEITAEWVLNEFKKNHEKAHEVGELQASNKALEMIGKHLGMFKDKVEHTGSMGVNIVNDIPRSRNGKPA